jgi:hypothetical protein
VEEVSGLSRAVGDGEGKGKGREKEGREGRDVFTAAEGVKDIPSGRKEAEAEEQVAVALDEISSVCPLPPSAIFRLPLFLPLPLDADWKRVRRSSSPPSPPASRRPQPFSRLRRKGSGGK